MTDIPYHFSDYYNSAFKQLFNCWSAFNMSFSIAACVDVMVLKIFIYKIASAEELEQNLQIPVTCTKTAQYEYQRWKQFYKNFGLKIPGSYRSTVCNVPYDSNVSLCADRWLLPSIIQTFVLCAGWCWRENSVWNVYNIIAGVSTAPCTRDCVTLYILYSGWIRTLDIVTVGCSLRGTRLARHACL